MRAGILLVVLMLMTLDVGAATWNVIKVEGRRYVPTSDVARFYRLEEKKSTGKDFVLSGPGRQIRGRAGTREIYVNGVKYVLCFPLSLQKGRVYVSAMDVTKIIEPVMRPGKIKDAATVKTIVLDAGHGGHDSGATGPLGREKSFALDVVLRARQLLVKEGYDVKLTRSTDVFVPLEERARFANRYPNSLFFSVHFNKSKSTGGTGIETYALAPRGVPSMDEENLSYSDFKHNPGNDQDPQNIALAAAVHSAMVNNLRITDRGIKRARFAVIRLIQVPGVLIEGGFMNNPLDSRLIAMPEYRQRIALSILQAVKAYTQSVTGTEKSAIPTLIVKGTDPTTVPDLEKAVAAFKQEIADEQQEEEQPDEDSRTAASASPYTADFVDETDRPLNSPADESAPGDDSSPSDESTPDTQPTPSPTPQEQEKVKVGKWW